ncbi:MAG: S24/S26 family peptidase [Alistipes sp.]|nr:S24/S26 family peptidase [Alistipes sp.]MBR7170356.1 S24/S26 family peptidase [Alistipes sp.]
MSNNVLVFGAVRDLLLEGKSVKISVKGQSMLPFFRSGSTILLRPLRDGDLRRLNVVLADIGGHFAVHRIIRVEPNRITLLGDGNIAGVEIVAPEAIYGIVEISALHRFFARLWLWMRPLRRYPLAILRRICRK